MIGILRPRGSRIFTEKNLLGVAILSVTHKSVGTYVARIVVDKVSACKTKKLLKKNIQNQCIPTQRYEPPAISTISTCNNYFAFLHAYYRPDICLFRSYVQRIKPYVVYFVSFLFFFLIL